MMSSAGVWKLEVHVLQLPVPLSLVARGDLAIARTGRITHKLNQHSLKFRNSKFISYDDRAFFIYVQGVSFRIDEVELTPELRRVYNKAVDLWVEMLHKFTEAADLIGQ
jgi:hypothetical protein